MGIVAQAAGGAPKVWLKLCVVELLAHKLCRLRARVHSTHTHTPIEKFKRHRYLLCLPHIASPSSPLAARLYSTLDSRRKVRAVLGARAHRVHCALYAAPSRWHIHTPDAAPHAACIACVRTHARTETFARQSYEIWVICARELRVHAHALSFTMHTHTHTHVDQVYMRVCSTRKVCHLAPRPRQPPVESYHPRAPPTLSICICVLSWHFASYPRPATRLNRYFALSLSTHADKRPCFGSGGTLNCYLLIKY